MPVGWDGPQLPPGSSVRAGDSEIISLARLVRSERYNLKNDLSERNDLAQKEPQKLKELSQLPKKKYTAVQHEGPIWKMPAPTDKSK